MKNSVLCLIAVIMMAFVSCNVGNVYKVTVVKNEGHDNYIGRSKAVVVTQSGDSVEAIIPESLFFDNKLPFSATMIKNEQGKYGLIKDSIVNVHDVIVKEKVTDLLLAGNKVIVETKSGMLLECYITEELLLKNKLPFSAKMTNEERFLKMKS
jgi:hypothetical protein